MWLRSVMASVDQKGHTIWINLVIGVVFRVALSWYLIIDLLWGVYGLYMAKLAELVLRLILSVVVFEYLGIKSFKGVKL